VIAASTPDVGPPSVSRPSSRTSQHDRLALCTTDHIHFIQVRTECEYMYFMQCSIFKPFQPQEQTEYMCCVYLHRRREVPNLEILDTNIAFQIGVDVFLCPASHPKLGIRECPDKETWHQVSKFRTLDS
jgi:hypothetical protein